MKKLIFSALVGMFFMLSFTVNINAAGVSGKNRLDFTYHRSLDGLLQVRAELGSEWNNPDSCDRSNSVVLSTSNPERDKFYDSIISAHLANKVVQFQLSGCINWNGVSYPEIVGVYIF